jgi:hypothetical protein|nr:MAG TPA: hypothetical protein [Caudoviricetes sp.]
MWVKKFINFLTGYVGNKEVEALEKKLLPNKKKEAQELSKQETLVTQLSGYGKKFGPCPITEEVRKWIYVKDGD